MDTGLSLNKLFRYEETNIDLGLRDATEGYKLDPENSFLPTPNVEEKIKAFVQEPTTDVISFPYLTPEYCKNLISLCEDIDQFKHRPGDEFPAPEMDLKDISPYLNTTHVEFIEKHVLPIATAIWKFPVIWLASAFVVKHTVEGQTGNPGWHHDGMGDVTLSVQLNEDFESGGVFFERQKYMAGKLPVGEAILFPSKVTHRHTALNITSGTRYSLTYWMSGHIPSDQSLRIEEQT